jgi:hypothetical protein
MAASIFVLIDFETNINVLFDFKHQCANCNTPPMVVFGLGHSENNHGVQVSRAARRDLNPFYAVRAAYAGAFCNQLFAAVHESALGL